MFASIWASLRCTTDYTCKMMHLQIADYMCRNAAAIVEWAEPQVSGLG